MRFHDMSHRGMWGAVPLAFSTAGGFPGSALCPSAREIEEPLAQFWVGDHLARRAHSRAYSRHFVSVLMLGCSEDDGWRTAAKGGGSGVPVLQSHGSRPRPPPPPPPP